MPARLRQPLEVVRAFLRDAGVLNVEPVWSDDYTEPCRLWEVVVPADGEVREKLSARPHFLSTIDPMDTSLSVVSDVLTFFPIPLPDWQTVATDVLKKYASAWRTELQRIRTELENAVMFTLPFAQMIVGAPDEWVTLHRIDVRIDDYLRDWGRTENDGWISYVKRPCIVWPTGIDASTHRTMIVKAGEKERPLSIVRPPLAYDELKSRR
jgi:hypothetical protein